MSRLLALVLVLSVTSAAQAQEAVDPEAFRLPEPGEISALRRGVPSPRDGLLIAADDLLHIQMEYDRLRYLLGRTQERDGQVCDARVEMERMRIGACEERLALRDTLWTARQAELLAQIAEAREAARRAGERGWYEHPAMWFAVGVLATAAVWIAATVR